MELESKLKGLLWAEISSNGWIDSMTGMTISKYPSHQGKIRLQGKEAKEGLALGLEISACWT